MIKEISDMNKRIKRKRLKAITTCKRCTGRRLKTLCRWANQYAKTNPSHYVSKSSISHINEVYRYMYTPFFKIPIIGLNVLSPLFYESNYTPSLRSEHIKTVSFSSIRRDNMVGSRYVFIGGLRSTLGYSENFIIDLSDNKLLDIIWDKFDDEENILVLYYTSIKGLKKMHVYSDEDYRATYLTNLEDEEIGDWTENIDTFLRYVFRENHIPDSQDLVEVLESEMII